MSTEGEAFSIVIVVPGKPRGKGAGRAGSINGRPGIFTDSKTRTEMGVIRSLAFDAMAGRMPYGGPIILRLCAYKPIPTSFSKAKIAAVGRGEFVPITKPDLDNYNKMVDALNSIVWKDDAQVVTAVLHKRYSDQPRLVLDIRSFPADAG